MHGHEEDSRVETTHPERRPLVPLRASLSVAWGARLQARCLSAFLERQPREGRRLCVRVRPAARPGPVSVWRAVLDIVRSPRSLQAPLKRFLAQEVAHGTACCCYFIFCWLPRLRTREALFILPVRRNADGNRSAGIRERAAPGFIFGRLDNCVLR